MYYYHVVIVESDGDCVVARSNARAHVCSPSSRARGPEISGGNRQPGEEGGGESSILGKTPRNAGRRLPSEPEQQEGINVVFGQESFVVFISTDRPFNR